MSIPTISNMESQCSQQLRIHPFFDTSPYPPTSVNASSFQSALARSFSSSMYSSNRIRQSRVLFMVPVQIGQCSRGVARRTYILKSGSQTVTALLENRPLPNSGVSKKKCLSTEHSITLPDRDSSSIHRSYAETTVETRVKHSGDTASIISWGTIDVWTMPGQIAFMRMFSFWDRSQLLCTYDVTQIQ